MQIYTYIYLYICLYIQVYAYIYTYIQICTNVYIYIQIYKYIDIYNKKPPHGSRMSNTRTKPSIYIYTYRYIYIVIYMYICVYIYIHIYTKKPPHGSRTPNKRTTPPREYNIDRQAQSHGGSHRHGGEPREALRRGRGGPYREHPAGAPIGSINREGRPSFVPPSLCVSLHVSVN
jgi:hypothetical protein